MNIKLTRVSRSRRRISLTPLIDVVFILLVFFMLESSFVRVRSVALSLPTGESAVPAGLIRIQVLAEGAVRLNDATLADREWVDILAQRANPADSPVLISTVSSVSMQRLIQVLDDLRALGFKQLALSPAHQKTTP